MSNLANILTMSRIVVILPIIILFLVMGNLMSEYAARWASLCFYTLACVTDFFDGYVARNMNQVSKLGRFLDPIADKLLVSAILLLVVGKGDLGGPHLVPALIILLREIIVSGLREFLAELQVRVPVSNLAKWKTTIQMLALGFVIVGPASPEFIPAILIGQVLIWAAAILTLITGYDYLLASLKHMTEDER